MGSLIELDLQLYCGHSAPLSVLGSRQVRSSPRQLRPCHISNNMMTKGAQLSGSLVTLPAWFGDLKLNLGA